MEELRYLKDEIQGLKSMQNEHTILMNNNTSLGIIGSSARHYKQPSEPRSGNALQQQQLLEQENSQLREQLTQRAKDMEKQKWQLEQQNDRIGNLERLVGDRQDQVGKLQELVQQLVAERKEYKEQYEETEHNIS